MSKLNLSRSVQDHLQLADLVVDFLRFFGERAESRMMQLSETAGGFFTAVFAVITMLVSTPALAVYFKSGIQQRVSNEVVKAEVFTKLREINLLSFPLFYLHHNSITNNFAENNKCNPHQDQM